MDLNWKHQTQRMTYHLWGKLESLWASLASLRQTITILRTAIISSLTYTFAVNPCAKTDLIIKDTTIRNVIK